MSNRSDDGWRSAQHKRAALPRILLLAVLAAAGCKHVQPLDTKPLDAAGMDYSTIKQLAALKITPNEIAQMAKVRGAGFSDPSCLEIFHVYHDRGRPFEAGDAVAGLVQVHISEPTILELARLDQLGLNAGEYETMRLAGLSEQIILEVARRRAAGKPVLSGPSLASLKNTGLRDATLLELARHGVPDSEVSSIVAARRHGAKDAEILRRFPGS
ncbi:MAG TPA: hypothetical protein VEU52_03405 [Candidatus Limnocylindrales bacterium]|nr:hypothetical protein [Candidatus Limnocylindrales bacterium]